MIWREQHSISRLLQTMLLLVPLILFISIYKGMTALFILGVLVPFLYWGTLAFFKSTKNALYIMNEKRTYRLFPGDTETITLDIGYFGKWPSLNGHLSVSYRDVIKDVNNENNALGDKKLQTFERTISTGSGQQQRCTFHIKGSRRGVTRLNNISLQLRDMFSFGIQYLEYDKLYQTEIVVYPEPLPVFGLEKLHQAGYGDYHTSHSLYEDVTFPSGAREYKTGDSFGRIHWKATARTGDLQTKVYEKTTLFRWTFLFTLPAGQHEKNSMKAEDLEKQISYLAFMCRFASHKNIPFELFINIRVPGPGQIIRMEPGEGKEHLVQVLETLSRIDISSMATSPESMLAKVDGHLLSSQPFVIISGAELSGTACYAYMQRWKKRGGNVYQVAQTGSEAFLLSYFAERRISS
ncbi:DUF58 domain-containing protein [Fictibacillus iocasae]|uniref:DUF58 domain-containing protein n=1 Tax=Fictibacillus iocasae TaxID=2715437 RepID=A0ABW2NHL2_9BACL